MEEQLIRIEERGEARTPGEKLKDLYTYSVVIGAEDQPMLNLTEFDMESYDQCAQETSPLMMFRPGEKSSEKKQNSSSSLDQEQRKRTSSEEQLDRGTTQGVSENGDGLAENNTSSLSPRAISFKDSISKASAQGGVSAVKARLLDAQSSDKTMEALKQQADEQRSVTSVAHEKIRAASPSTLFQSTLVTVQNSAQNRNDADYREEKDNLLKITSLQERERLHELDLRALEDKARECSEKADAVTKAAKEALIKGDTAAAELYSQVAKAVGGHDAYNPGAAYSYREAAKEQEKGNSQAAEALHKAALQYEAQAEALSKGDTAAAELHAQAAKAVGGHNEYDPGANYAYSEAAKEQEKGNSQAAEAWRKAALSYEAQAEALSKGDTATAELHAQAAKAAGGHNEYNPGAAYAYHRATEEQEKGNSQAAEAWRKAALQYEAQAEALSKGDTATAGLHARAAQALKSYEYDDPGAVYAYRQAAEEQRQGNNEAAEAYRKAALQYEAQAEALSKDDRAAAELHYQAAKAFREAADAYPRAAQEQWQKNNQAAEAWRKAALQYEAQAEALSKGDTASAELHYQAAKALGGYEKNPGAAFAYSEAVKEQRYGNSKAAEAWRKAALQYEAQVEALIKGDTAAAELYAQAAKVLGGYKYGDPGAASAYSKADTGQRYGSSKAAEAWHKAALQYEAQVEALIKGDRAAAEFHSQLAETLGGDWRQTPGAAYAYSEAADEQRKGNSQAAEAWSKAALQYEAQVEARIKGDTVAAEFHSQLAKAYGGCYLENPGAAYAYSKATRWHSQRNSDAAEALHKAALQYEAQAEAFIKGDNIASELHHQVAMLLGGNEDSPGAASAYNKAFDERSNGSFISSAIWIKTAQECEAKATALEKEIEEMLGAPKNSAAYKEVATVAFKKIFASFKSFLSLDGNEVRQKKEKRKQILEEAKKALLEYDQPINQFPRVLEQASTSVTDDTPSLKAWFDQQLTEAKKTKTALNSKLIDLLDFSTGEHQAVFWTGYVDGNQTLAMHFSKENDKKTLEMTAGGQFLDELNLYGKKSVISVRLADALFDVASEKFAKGAMGEINAFLPHEEPRANSVFKRIEEPILKEKPISLTFRKKPKYDYWRTIAEREEYKNIYDIFDDEALRAKNTFEWMPNANHLRQQASKALGEAFASINAAVISPIDKAISLWEEATHQADRTQQLWSQVTTVFEKANVPEVLKTDLPKLLQHFQSEASSWTAEIKWRQLRHQAAMVDLHEERISKLLVTNDSHLINVAADEEAQLMIGCERAADEWIGSENNLNKESKEKEYNNLKTTVAANRCKLVVAKSGAEVIAALNNMAPQAKTAKEAEQEKEKLQAIIKSYADALNAYQQLLQRVEEGAPEEWSTARGWSLIAEDWKKNRRAIEELERMIILKMESIDIESEEDQKKVDNKNKIDPSNSHIDRNDNGENKEETNRASKTTLADVRKSVQEGNQTFAHQFSKEINKLILDMAAGKEVK
jgi:hypothetical protein